MSKEECPKCKQRKILTKHHIYPKKHFKKSDTFKLCRECHDELHKIIPQQKMPKFMYEYILARFLTEERKVG